MFIVIARDELEVMLLKGQVPAGGLRLGACLFVFLVYFPLCVAAAMPGGAAALC